MGFVGLTYKNVFTVQIDRISTSVINKTRFFIQS